MDCGKKTHWPFTSAPAGAAEIWFGLSRLEADWRRRRLPTNEFRRLCAALRWADWSEPTSCVFGQWNAALH